MRNMRLVFTAIVVSILLAPFLVRAQNPPAQGQPGQAARGPQAPPQPMSFFVSSAGSGKGGDLGGLQGADAICQRLATAAGSTKTWHAYLSTQGPNAANARERIGSGPWYNARGQLIGRGLAELHGDTLELAQVGNPLGKQLALNEQQKVVNGVGDTPNQHDILTGSKPDGRAYTDGMDHTCSNWTSSVAGMGSAQVGHSDKQGGGNSSWNSTHASRGCSQENLVSTGGAGMIYCFAIN